MFEAYHGHHALQELMAGSVTGIRIIRARESSLAEINALIALSKAHWSWPEGYLERALPLQRVSEAYVSGNHCFEVRDASCKLVAFTAVVVGDGQVVLDNLWVTPELLGRGIGRHTFEHVLRLARAHGWRELRVLPEPPAEGFYRKVGFTDTGERMKSRVPGGPLYSVYRIEV